MRVVEGELREITEEKITQDGLEQKPWEERVRKERENQSKGMKLIVFHWLTTIR